MTTDVLTAHPAAAHLRMLFSMNDSLLSKNLDRVTPEIALARPGEGNPIAWSLGHIVFWRQAMLGMAGATRVWQEGAYDGFKGMSREAPAGIDCSWDEIVSAYQESHARLLAALHAVADLPAEAVKSLAQLQCHETYHIGQVAMARRVAGLPGAV